VIPNPYDDGVFKNNTGGARDEDLIFVGRLVSDKGADGLLQALSLLKRRGIRPRLTIVGDGPERDVLERLAQELELKAQIDFVGVKAPADIAGLLTRHKILVVPSLWNEPFGIVALEGIACGCAVLGSNGGGLPEAMGPCGLTFERGNAGDLADKIEMLLGDLELRSTLQTNADWHLRKHQPAAVAARYLDVIERAISKYG
jgi:glycosyltransferase involved in cell wall biosynthesis